MLTIACCLVVWLGLRLDIVSGWLVVMHAYSVVIVTLPNSIQLSIVSFRVESSRRNSNVDTTRHDATYLHKVELDGNWAVRS